MSEEYDAYLKKHKAAVVDSWNFIKNKCPGLLEDLTIPVTAMDAIIANHDRSKYQAVEYGPYDDYFYGDKKDEDAFDRAWLHHIHYNKHHWQHWILIKDEGDNRIIALEMPYECVLEMICDCWAFSWVKGDLYEIFDWYRTTNRVLHEKTQEKVMKILNAIKKAIDKNQ